MAIDLYSRLLKRQGDNQKKENTEETKKKRNKRILTLALIVVFVIVILSITVPKRSSNIVTGYIQNGSLEKTAAGTIKFMRKELVATAESNGKVIAAIKEGERAAKDEIVAYVTNPDQEETALELIKVDTQIVAADTYSDSTFTTLLSGGGQLSKAITNTMIDSSRNAVKGSFRDYQEKEAGIDTYFTLKNSLASDVSSKDEYIAMLKQKKEALLEKMGSGIRAVTAPESGIVSYCIDGYEDMMEELDFENARSFDLKSVNENGDSRNGTSVKRGDAVFKVDSSFDYYVLVNLPGYSHGETEKGTTVTIQADNREFNFKGSVVRFETNENGAEILLRCTASQPSTISYRVRNADVVLQSVSGMKVPVKALTDWDSAKVTAKITLIRANFVESLFVNVDSFNDEYAIISNRESYGEDTAKAVTPNDMYVQNPGSVDIGELLR